MQLLIFFESQSFVVSRTQITDRVLVQHGYLFLLIAAVPDPYLPTPPILLTPSVWSVLVALSCDVQVLVIHFSFIRLSHRFLSLSLHPRFNNRYLTSAQQRGQLDLLQEMNRMHLEERGQDEQLESRIASLEMAYRMQGEAQEAFDPTRNPEATRLSRWPFGSGGASCRLVRAKGVGAGRGSFRFTTATTSRGTTTPTSPTTATTPAPATSRSRRSCGPKSRGCFDDTLAEYGAAIRPHADLERAARSRPPPPRLHDVAGRGRRQGRHGFTEPRRIRIHATEDRMHVHGPARRRYCT